MTVLRATPWVAGSWVAVFLPLAVLGLLGRTAHPWSPDPASALGSLSVAAVSVVIVVVGTAVLTAMALGLRSRRGTPARVAAWTLIALGVLVAVAVSDVRALAFLGYLPMLVLGLAGVGPAAGHLEWSLVTNAAAALAHAVGGVAIAVTGARALGRPWWRGWVRWGRPAVAVAVAVPLLYAATRIAWALDVPLGMSRESLDDLGSGRYAGLGLALFAVVGAWLTTGLLARWGEVFWPWVPGLGGRRVPVALALVPGLVVAGAVTSAGLSFWRLVLTGHLSEVPGASEDWAAWGPELFWPVWGVALALACLAYLGRRTGAATPPVPARSPAPAR